MGCSAICSKFNRYIIITTLTALLNKCLFGLNYMGIFKDVRIVGENFSKNIVIHKIFNYFGLIFLAAIFYRVEVYSVRRGTVLKSQQKQKEKDKEKKNNKRKKTEIELIYVDNEEEHRKFKSFRFLFFYLLVIFTWIVEEQLIESFSPLFPNLDFWMIELFVICYLNSMVFKVQIFNHQIFAILFSIFSSLLKICTIILCFNDDSINIGEESIIYYLKSYPILKISIGIILYIKLIFLRSVVNLSLKWYMDVKYISPNKILMLYGIIGTIIYLIICFITTQFNCGSNFIIYEYICNVNYNNKNYIDSYYNYIDNFKTGFNEIIREIIVIISGNLIFFFNKLFSILIIKYLSPVHVIFSIPILFIFEKTVLFINTIIFSEENYYGFLAINNKSLMAKFFLDVSGDIFSLIGFLIYLEIIKLKCGGLHYNLRANIIERGAIELMVVRDNSFSSSFSSDIEKSLPEKGSALFRDSTIMENNELPPEKNE